MSPGKQRQRIAFLEKRLRTAQREKDKADQAVFSLKEEIREARLTLIRKQVDEFEKQIEKLQIDPYKFSQFIQREEGNLLIKERVELHEMIQLDPSPGAQALLDRILRLITELNDETRRI
ncbi:MAG: hypothetical protein JSS32_03980 [Verrucomicrobia bacterium]|nr:hypothetical protein [Verrucomicrobiota bacterium]